MTAVAASKKRARRRKARSPERISLKEYARRRGVTPRAVRRAIEEGRISAAAERESRAWAIDAELADRLWAGSTDPALQRGQDAGAGGGQSGYPPGPPGEGAVGEADFGRDEEFMKARARRESWQADLAALRAQEQAAELCRVSAVRRSGFDHARRTRNKMLSIPARVSARLAAETDSAEIHRILTEEVTLALQELAGLEGEAGGE